MNEDRAAELHEKFGHIWESEDGDGPGAEVVLADIDDLDELRDLALMFVQSARLWHSEAMSALTVRRRYGRAQAG